MASNESLGAEYRRTLGAALASCWEAIGDHKVGVAIVIGCGRGVELPLIASIHPAAELIGYDVCPAAMEYMRHRLDSRGASHVRLYQADIETLEAPDTRRPIDLIICVHTLHLLHEPTEATRRWAEWAAPGALLITIDWLNSETIPPIDQSWTEEQRHVWPLTNFNHAQPSTQAMVSRRSRYA